ncbi:Protein of unknown function [Gryllus bimaculatus]|nr:Protein of unknown function [Gryllus bimaculatus]
MLLAHSKWIRLTVFRTIRGMAECAKSRVAALGHATFTQRREGRTGGAVRTPCATPLYGRCHGNVNSPQHLRKQCSQKENQRIISLDGLPTDTQTDSA